MQVKSATQIWFGASSVNRRSSTLVATSKRAQTSFDNPRPGAGVQSVKQLQPFNALQAMTGLQPEDRAPHIGGPYVRQIKTQRAKRPRPTPDLGGHGHPTHERARREVATRTPSGSQIQDIGEIFDVLRRT